MKHIFRIAMRVCAAAALLSLSALVVYGQGSSKGFGFYGDGKEPTQSSVLRVIDSVIVDTSKLIVSYKADFKMSPDGKDRWNITRLYIGEHYSLFLDYSTHLKAANEYGQQDYMLHLMYTRYPEISTDSVNKLAHSRFPSLEGMGNSYSYYYKSVLSDNKTKISKVTVPDIWSKSVQNRTMRTAHIYEEDTQVLDWIISDEIEYFSGYNCQKAECDFRGRRWVAWFTTEIPVAEGPWKLKGLPGLIVQAEDTTGQYRFRMIGISDIPEPICDYKYEDEDVSSYKKYKRYERSCYLWPKSFNENMIVLLNINNKMEEADHRNWQMDYYPMEWLKKSRKIRK